MSEFQRADNILEHSFLNLNVHIICQESMFKCFFFFFSAGLKWGLRFFFIIIMLSDTIAADLLLFE